jgi:hypothetical protein
LLDTRTVFLKFEEPLSGVIMPPGVVYYIPGIFVKMDTGYKFVAATTLIQVNLKSN